MTLSMSNRSCTAEGSRNAHVVVSPAQGGRVSSLELDGHQLLVPEQPSPLAWGCYPMVPFAGRLRRGRLTFDGDRHQLPVTHHGHAMHGYGHVSEWTVVEATDTRVKLAWSFCEPWPWLGSATQQFALAADSLTLTMSVEAHQRQPVSFGWHPWFRRDVGTDSSLDLTFDAKSMYELDDFEIPTGRIVMAPPGPWDNCFADVSQPIGLRWGSLGVELRSDTNFWVVYDEPLDALCVEPQTDVPNNVAVDPHVLDAGQTASAQFTISW